MATEIERKFLVKDQSWKAQVRTQAQLKQGYLSMDTERTVRIRCTNEKAFITVKGQSEGISRQEFEYKIPISDAIQMLGLCKLPPVEKTRHTLKIGHKTWEIDVFEGVNEGLVIAEVELTSESEKFPVPSWAGKEVSDDPKYFNVQLVQNPYSTWWYRILIVRGRNICKVLCRRIRSLK